MGARPEGIGMLAPGTAVKLTISTLMATVGSQANAEKRFI